jgi:flavin-dependent dehydrogenase
VIHILGGGLAGCAAAISASIEGDEVTVIEKSSFPKHKVCGEFLSGEAVPVLDSLGVSIPEAAPIRRASLRFSRSEKTFALPETALGVSRYLLDHRMQQHATWRGARFSRTGPAPDIGAGGRAAKGEPGKRLFGFKCHFDGPANDAVELYFFSGGYVGVNPVEGGRTNVCGVMPERRLRLARFEIDDVLASFPPLRERLASLQPAMEWLTTGPLVYQRRVPTADTYLCGDALLFTDPFTGSGMFAALATGAAAGAMRARNEPLQTYHAECDRILARAYRTSSFFRKVLGMRAAETLVQLVPGSWLYRLTRPSVST